MAFAMPLSLSKKSACGGLFCQKLKKCLRPGAQTARPPGKAGRYESTLEGLLALQASPNGFVNGLWGAGFTRAPCRVRTRMPDTGTRRKTVGKKLPDNQKPPRSPSAARRSLIFGMHHAPVLACGWDTIALPPPVMELPISSTCVCNSSKVICPLSRLSRS